MSDSAIQRPKLVLVGGKTYFLAAFEAAFNQTALAHVARRTANKSTPRQIMRTVAAMKSDRAHRVVLKEALELLSTQEPTSTLGDIAARFPAPDKV